MYQKNVIEKIKKFLFNAFFWLLFIINLLFLIYFIIYIPSNFNYFIEKKFISINILNFFNNYTNAGLVLYGISIYLNLFIFNNSIKKLIDKNKYNKIKTVEIILLIIGIILLIISPSLLSIANLSMTNYLKKSIFCSLHIISLITAFYLFYIFSFLCVITKDNCYNNAVPYIYKIKRITYDELTRSIMQSKNIKALKTFLNSDYTIEYFVENTNKPIIYSFIHLKSLEDTFIHEFKNNQLTKYINYLNSTLKIPQFDILYFIIIDEPTTSLEELTNNAIYQTKLINIIHIIFNLSSNEVYIGGIRETNKDKLNIYYNLKNDIDKTLSTIIENK